jgi:carbonic anhydrase
MYRTDNARRHFLKTAGLALMAGGSAPAVTLLPRPAEADGRRPPARTQDSQAALTPEMALQKLKDGNDRFVNAVTQRRNLQKQVRVTAEGQFPFAAIVGCMDSRASNELIFDQGIGDLFSQRVAGNYIDDGILGGLEFACVVAGAKFIVVLGHTECGAVKGACDTVVLGNLTRTLAKIEPAVAAVPGYGADRTSKNGAFVQAVAEQNVVLGVERIRERSPLLKERIDRKEVGLTGAMYDVRTGRVSYLPV